MSELFMIARLAGRTVAFAADQVESVVDLPPVTPVPLAPAAVRGIAALRSRVVTVVDPALLLGQERGCAGRRAVVTRIAAHDYAMLVDGVEDAAVFERQPVGGGLAPGGAWNAVAAGLVERDGQTLLVVDLAALVPLPDAAAA